MLTLLCSSFRSTLMRFAEWCAAYRPAHQSTVNEVNGGTQINIHIIVFLFFPNC